MPISFEFVLLDLSCDLSDVAHAADALAPCRFAALPDQETKPGLAKVIGAPRTYLLSDRPPCPDDSAACRTRAYLVPGDALITGAANGPYVCIVFPNGHGNAAGYVRTTQIAVQSLPATVPTSAWEGKWAYEDDSITLHAQGDRLIASDQAYYPRRTAPREEFPGSPNQGEFDGVATPRGNTVVFASKHPDGCRVTLELLPPFLLADDNLNCGGMNVTFMDIYRRK